GSAPGDSARTAGTPLARRAAPAASTRFASRASLYWAAHETPHRRELPRRVLRALLRHPRARVRRARGPRDRLAALRRAREHDRAGEARHHRRAVGRADARAEGP